MKEITDYGKLFNTLVEKTVKYLVDNNFVDCIIQLPENLFYGIFIYGNAIK